jgi:hypothetical protein
MFPYRLPGADVPGRGYFVTAGENMDEQDEIIDRLARLDRKVNYVITVVLALLGMAFGAVAYFVIREPVGDYYAFIVAVMLACALALFMEIWFRRSDP